MPKMTPPPIPEGMIELMKQLSKSVLKEKPDNIYEYAAKYFEQLLIERDGCLDKGYGKFRSYSEYCKFMKKMDAKRPMRIKHIQDESDSGIGSSNTDEESKNLHRKPQKPPPPDMEINGTAIQAATRKTKATVQPRKTKNYSVNPKFRPQGGIERDKKSSRSIVSNKEHGRNQKENDKTVKVKPKQRKLSSKKPSDSLIVITEETSVDVAEDSSDLSKVKKSAAIIQRAFRAYLVNKALKMIDTNTSSEPELKEKVDRSLSEDRAATIIQSLFKSFVQKKKNIIAQVPDIDMPDKNLKLIEDQVIVPIEKLPFTDAELELPVDAPINELAESDAKIVEEEIIVPIKVPPRHTEADQVEQDKIEIEAEINTNDAETDQVEQDKVEAEIIASDTETGNVVSKVENIILTKAAMEDKDSKIIDEIVETVQSVDEIDKDLKQKIENELEDITDVKEKEIDAEIDVKKSNNADISITSDASQLENEPPIAEKNKEDIKEHDGEVLSDIKENLENETNIEHDDNTKSTEEPIILDKLKNEPKREIENETINPENTSENNFNELVNEVITDSNALIANSNIITELNDNIKATVQDFIKNEKQQSSILLKEETENNEALNLSNTLQATLNIAEMLDNLPAVPDDELSAIVSNLPDESITKTTTNLNENEVLNNEEILLPQKDEVTLKTDDISKENLLEQSSGIDQKDQQESMNILLKEEVTDETVDPLEENLNKPEPLEPVIEDVVLEKALSKEGISPSDMGNTSVDSNKFNEILEDCVTDEDISALASSHKGSIIKIHDIEVPTEITSTEVLANERAKSLDNNINLTSNDDQPTKESGIELKKSLSEQNENIESKDDMESPVDNQEESLNAQHLTTEESHQDIAENSSVENQLKSDSELTLTEQKTDPIEISSGSFCGTSENSEHCQESKEIHKDAENIELDVIEKGEDQKQSEQENIYDSNNDDKSKESFTTEANTDSRIEPTAPLLEEIITADETAAAINIQKSYRGYRTRRDVKSKILEQSADADKLKVEHSTNADNSELSNVSILVSSQDGLGDILTNDQRQNQTNNNLLLLPISSSKLSIRPIEEVSETSDLSDRDLDQIEEPNIVNPNENSEGIAESQEENRDEQTNLIEDPITILPEEPPKTDTNNKKMSIQKQLSSDLSETEDISAEKFTESGVDETSRDERDDLSELDNFDFSSCGEDSLEAMYYSLRKNEILLEKMRRQAAEQRSSIAENSTEEPNNEEKELMQEAIEMNKKLTEKIAEVEMSISPVGHLDKSDTEKKNVDEKVTLSDDLTTAEDLTVINVESNSKVEIKDDMVESDSATDNNDIIVGNTVFESEDLTSSADETSLPGNKNNKDLEQELKQIGAENLQKLEPNDNVNKDSQPELSLKIEKDLNDSVQDQVMVYENSKAFEQFADRNFPELLSDDHTDSIDDQYIIVAGSDQEKENAVSLTTDKSVEQNSSEAISTTKEKTFETLSQNSFPKLLSDDLPDIPTDNDEINENSDQKNDEPVSTVSASSAFEEKTSTAIDESSSTNDLEITNPIAYAMKQQEKFLNVMHPSSHQSAMSVDEDNTASEELDEFPDYPTEHQHLENIRRNILASSISEADSDYIAPSATSKHLIKDDFNISTAFDHITSTDSDSTIISAATKIQAGARGFLTRRRLRRSSAGTSLSADRHCSFGNAAIDKSLEDLLEQQELNNLDDAAIKIQRSYRNYMNRNKRSAATTASTITVTTPPERSDIIYHSDESDSADQYGITEIKLEQKKLEQIINEDNNKTGEHVEVSPIATDEHEYYKNIYVSDENSLQNDAHRQEIINGTVNECQENSHHLSIMNFDELDTAQRRMTLQRGDAVQRHSTPEEYDLQQNSNTNNSVGNDKIIIQNDEATKPPTPLLEGNLENEKETVQSPATIIAEERKAVHRKLGPRQRSMPVQIDTEFMRIIPKHLRKRIKSAGSIKQKF